MGNDFTLNCLLYDVAVIGGGPAGLAAALAVKAADPALSVLILERDTELGGILRQCIHNGFGLHYFKEELTGPEYARRFIDRLKGTDIDVWTDTMVLEVTESRRVLSVSAARGLLWVQAKAVVLAMGCRERTRGALNIPGTRPAGVYTAGSAQRLVNMEGYLPGTRVVVLGSGDIGLIMARRMTWEGAKVERVVELMPYSSGLNRNIVQCLQDFNIPIQFNHTVTQIHGKSRLEAVTIAEVDPATRAPIPGTEEVIPCDTLLLSVGLIPENELSQSAGVELSRVTSGAVVDENRQTNVPGVFACGNVLHVHDLVDNVSEEAESAGRAAARYAKDAGDAGQALDVKPGPGVRYVVPQRVTAGYRGDLDLYFRVSDVYKNAKVVIREGERAMKAVKRSIVTPGEMEKLTVSIDGLSESITVGLEEG